MFSEVKNDGVISQGWKWSTSVQVTSKLCQRYIQVMSKLSVQVTPKLCQRYVQVMKE